MRKVILLALLLPAFAFGEGSDYWSKDKDINLPVGIGTTACSFYNDLDQSSEQTQVMNEFYSRWMDGWVSSFAMYSDWNIRNIEKTEYITFLKNYCKEFPQFTIARAAHTFTYRVKQ